MQEANRKGRAGAQSRARREVGIGVNFQAIAGFHLCQHLTHHGMHDFLDFSHVLQPRIRDPEPVLEKRRQFAHADVGILIDSSSEHGSAIFSKPRGVISAAAKQRNSKRCSADNHDHTILLLTVLVNVRIDIPDTEGDPSYQCTVPI
jgi:hypothetical protein